MNGDPLVRIRDGELRLGSRTLWDGLDLAVAPGELVAVLGPNGAGKTTLLRVVLGLVRLTYGSVEVFGAPPERGDRRIGYVPQQKGFDAKLPVRGRDLVRFGLDGDRFGLVFGSRNVRARVDAAIEAVGAHAYADAPIGELSGGEQQRLRIAQALVADARLLLCDEPLLSLDLAHQQAVSELLAARCRAGNGVVFVTHDINPILEHTDRVLYLVDGRWASGRPGDVMTSETLSRLYGAPVEVLDVQGRLVVIGAHDSPAGDHAHHDHDHGHDSGHPRRRVRR